MKFQEKVKFLMKSYPRLSIGDAIEALEIRGGHLMYAQEYLDRKDKPHNLDKDKFPEWYKHLREQAQNDAVPF